MQIIQMSVKGLTRIDYFTKHLHIINTFLPHELTNKEIEVLAEFMAFTGELAEKDRFATSLRKEVREKLKLNHSGLSNYLDTFKKKKVITEGLGGILHIAPYLFPEEGIQYYQFKIIQDVV